MTSDPPPNSTATFDALWESLDEEANIPAAIDPNAAAQAVPPQQRDTLVPPVPPPEYVQTMMELGEIDDPSGHHLFGPAPAPPRPPSPPPAPRAPGRTTASGAGLAGLRAGPGAGPATSRRTGAAPDRTKTPVVAEPKAALGLVMASEAELLLQGEGAPAFSDATARAPNAALPRAGTGTTGRRPSSPAMKPPPIPGIPIPRAPSLPPPPMSVRDGGGFDELDALDGLPFGDLAPAEPRRPAAQESSPPLRAVAPPRPPPRRAMTPPVRPGSMTPPPQVAAGLRLGRPITGAAGTPALRPQQRDTPVADVGALAKPLEPMEEPAPTSAILHVRKMQERLSARDYRGALVEAEGLLAADPANADAKRTAESCREMLAQKYLGSLGGRDQIPRALMAPDEVRRLSLDHRAGFLLSFIDGCMTVDEVLDGSSMPELDALQIMYELREQGVIEIAAPARRPGRRS